MSFSLGLLLLGISWQASPLDELIRDPLLEGAAVGVCVMDSSGNEVWAHNADLRLIPASLQKLATCAWAWESLGGDHRPRTRFWRSAKGVVADAEGDPSLTATQLDQVRRRLGLSQGVTVFARQAFAPQIPPGWEHDDLVESYAGRICAFTVDGGKFQLWAVGGRPVLRPRNYGVKLAHKAGSGPVVVRFEPWASRLAVQGRLPSGRVQLAELPIPHPDRAAAAWLGGQLATAREVPTRSPDATVHGAPVRRLVQQCLTDSDNTVAEHLLLLAASRDGALPEDPYDHASRSLARFLEERVGVPANAWIVADGSGLSRHNVTTARAVCMLLLWAAARPWGSDFVAAFAAPGTGTLRTRLAGSAVRGKTGSLDLVNALAGFTTRADGAQIAFAVLVNHSSAKSRQIRQLIDRFAQRLEQ